jgi:DNA-directed RNA polymerase specialized sigma24 family protein
MGPAPCPEAILTAYVTALIRVKARQLVRDHLFRRSDEEDLRQELTLRLLKRARRYNPARASLHTFADRVVASLAATLVRERRRQKNGARLRRLPRGPLRLRRRGRHALCANSWKPPISSGARAVQPKTP